MRTLVTILCSLLLAVAAYAGPNFRQSNSSDLLSGFRSEVTESVDNTPKLKSKVYAGKMDKDSKYTFHTKKMITPIRHSGKMQAPANSGEELHQVYLDIIEPEGYYHFITGLGTPYASYWDEAYDGMMLASGEYCFVAVFAAESDGKAQKIIVKNVNLDSDITITIDGNEATEKVAFQSLLPDGTPIKGADLDEMWNVLEPGNISTASNGYINSALCSGKWGMLFYYETTFGTFTDSATGENADEPEGANFLFNPDASDDLIVSQYCSFFGADNESCYLIQMNSTGTKAQTVQNNIKDYHTTTYSEIMTTEYYLKDIQNEMTQKDMIFGWYAIINGIPEYENYAMGDIVNNAVSLLYCIPSLDNTLPIYTIYPYIDNFDLGKPIDSGDGVIRTPIYRVTPSAFRFEDGKLKLMVAPMLDGPYNSKFFYTENGVSRDLVITGQPSYSFLRNESMQVAGDNAPFIQIIDNSLPSKNSFGFQYLMLGRVGESPQFLYESSGEFDGQSVNVKSDDDDSVFLDVWYPFWENVNKKYKTYDGIIKLGIQSRGTIMVDGTIPSYAKSENVWNFAQKEDRIVPQLTMFQFRNIDNIVTDRFEQPSDGILTLSCADFNNVREFIYNENGQPIGIKQYSPFNGTPDVTVEYSPINRNDWRQLEVEEKPDEFYMPGYGSFFRGNLGSIDCKAADGWFDIRFKLADNAGNTQTVTVSPAFNIASLAGISDVKTDRSVIKVDGNNIIAPAEATVYNAAGIRVGRNSLPSGIYMVTYKGNTTKCMIF